MKTKMPSRASKSRRSLLDEELRPNIPKKTTDDVLTELSESVTLRDIPLEDRRREANKPLFLKRYE
jgi:hypothetical protein